MSVEENKKIHLKLHEGIWMGRNLELVDEVLGEDYVPDMGRGESQTNAQMKEMLKSAWAKMDNNNRKIVRTEYHGKIGEGDLLAVWQTNYFSDDSSSEEINLFRFENGKIATFKSFKS